MIDFEKERIVKIVTENGKEKIFYIENYRYSTISEEGISCGGLAISRNIRTTTVTGTSEKGEILVFSFEG